MSILENLKVELQFRWRISQWDKSIWYNYLL